MRSPFRLRYHQFNSPLLLHNPNVSRHSENGKHPFSINTKTENSLTSETLGISLNLRTTVNYIYRRHQLWSQTDPNLNPQSIAQVSTPSLSFLAGTSRDTTTYHLPGFSWVTIMTLTHTQRLSTVPDPD